MKKTLIIFLLCLGIFANFPSHAIYKPENLYIKNINLKQGLSQCIVTNIVEDHRGFVWLGTFDGLNRFDGKNIKVFKHDPDDSTSILSSKVYRIFADKNDHLYLNTNEGFCVFDCKTEKLLPTTFNKKNINFAIANKDAYHIWLYEKKKGILEVDTRDFRYQVKENSLIPSANVQDAVKLIPNGNFIYIIMYNGDVCVYDLVKKTNIIYPNTIYSNASLSEYKYTSSELVKNDKIYITSYTQDLIVFDIIEKKFIKSNLYEKNTKLIAINSLKYDSTNNLLYIGTYGQGLFIYDYANDTLRQFKKGDNSLPISSNYILNISINKYGLIYIAYDGMGLDVLDPYIKKFSPIIRENVDDKSTLKYVRKIVEDNEGNLFIGTSESGLVKYNRTTNQLTFFNFKTSLTENRAFIIDMIKIGNELWLGYNGSGVGVIDINTQKEIRNYSVGENDNQISNGTIWSFYKDSNYLWVGTRENGINKIDLLSHKVKQFTKKQFPVFAENGIRTIYKSKNNHFILGTEKGLYKFDIVNEKVKLIFPLFEKEYSFKSIKSIMQDAKDRYWVATDGGGIVILDSNFKMLKNFNTNNGLNNNVVYGILPENDSTYWISTNAGLCTFTWNEKNIYSKEALSSHTYDEINGLQSNEFNTGAYALLSDNSMVFGGLNGINVFNPKGIKNSPIKPDIYVNEFKVFENSLNSPINISYLNEVNLAHFENSISISFSILGFAISEKTNYLYKLEGYDKNWISSKDRNYVSYTNLPSGKYIFKVKASNYDGIWSSEPLELKINIATPFYNTWWFYALSLLFLSAIGFSFYKYRTKLIRDKEEIKLQFTKEIAEVEMKALRAQINPHFLFNSLNSINNYILKNDTKQASRYLVKFSQLVRSILNNSSNTYISLQEELNTIELYMLIEGMRFSNQFTYNIEVEEGLNTSTVNIPSLLLQPYVENAIWHGLLHKEGEKNILISVKNLNNNAVSIIIEDNGVGRSAAQDIKITKHHKSFGMQLGESRLRLLNQQNGQTAKVNVIDLYNNLKEPVGTKIDIVLPLKNHQNHSTQSN